MEDPEPEAADTRMPVPMDATGMLPLAAATKGRSDNTQQGITYNGSVPAVVVPSIPDPAPPIPRLDGASTRGNFAAGGRSSPNTIGGVYHDERQHPWCQVPSSGAPAHDHCGSGRRRRHCTAR